MEDITKLLDKKNLEFGDLPSYLLNFDRFLSKIRKEKSTGVLYYWDEKIREIVLIHQGKAFLARILNILEYDDLSSINFLVQQIYSGIGKVSFYNIDKSLIIALAGLYIGKPLYTQLDVDTIIPSRFFALLQKRGFSGVVFYESSSEVKYWLFQKGTPLNVLPGVLPPKGNLNVFVIEGIPLVDYFEEWEKEERKKIIGFSQRILSNIAKMLVERWGQNATELILLPLERTQGPLKITFDRKTWNCYIESQEEITFLAQEVERLYARLLREIRARGEESFAEKLELSAFNMLQEEKIIWPNTGEKIFRR
ncbi:MAG: hypothetical protein NZ841_02845 [Dictyoglomus sp.]|nr:hypothetical protein [Dictyoglomus sp.]MCX7942645.1 hypothetical protein [Dictyoglomaceae bacterium]MDW8188215.1 hypothetical protein [Dictyoglomus sp.]